MQHVEWILVLTVMYLPSLLDSGYPPHPCRGTPFSRHVVRGLPDYVFTWKGLQQVKMYEVRPRVNVGRLLSQTE